MNVKEVGMDSVGSKPDLFEQGTRYDHYVELKEVFLLGIDVIDRMNPNYVSDGDRAMKRELETTSDSTISLDLLPKRVR